MPKSKTKFQEKWLIEIDPSGHQYSLMSIMPVALSVERNLDVTIVVSYD
jgi:hypothetical protein